MFRQKENDIDKGMTMEVEAIGYCDTTSFSPLRDNLESGHSQLSTFFQFFTLVVNLYSLPIKYWLSLQKNKTHNLLVSHRCDCPVTYHYLHMHSLDNCKCRCIAKRCRRRGKIYLFA